MKKLMALTPTLLLGIAMLIGISLPRGQRAAGLPSASVTGLSASVSGVSVDPNPACAANVTVTANVSGNPDSNTSSTNVGGCQGKTQTTTKTDKTYTDLTLSVTATDSKGNSTPLSDNHNGTWSGSLPAGQPDGKTTVTVSATASETESTDTTTTVSTYPSAPCSGTPIISVSNSHTGVTKTSSAASATSSYLSDLNPPAIDNLAHNTGVGNDVQGGFSVFSFRVTGGSPNQGLNVTITMTSVDSPSNIYMGTISDTFGNLVGSAANATEPQTHELMKVDIPCDAPLGTYNVDIHLSSTDLCGDAQDVHYIPDPVTIGPGLTLNTAELVIADFGTAGYDIAQCFTATKSGTKVNTYPGSFHTATLVKSQGPCADISTLSNVVITQTIPVGFEPFDKTKPLVGTHVFYPAGSDLHYPGQEITLGNSAVTYINSSGTWTVTINVPGSYAAAGAIYARTHVRQVLPAVPTTGTTYQFSTTASANSGSLSSNGAGTLTYSASCVDGKLP